MTTRQTRLRSRSLSGGQAQLDAPRLDGTRRAAVPRAASTSNMHGAMSMAADRDLHDETSRNIAREQIDRETMRDLAHFFRTTGPPVTRDSMSMDHCFRLPVSSETRRWSMQSLRRKRDSSLQRPGSLQLRDKAVPKTTAAGHSYIAISVPGGSRGERRPLSKSRFPVLQRPHFPQLLDTMEREWPQRTSSRGMHSPTSPTSSNARTFFLERTPSERSSMAPGRASIVSRNSLVVEARSRLSIAESTEEDITTPKIEIAPTPPVLQVSTEVSSKPAEPESATTTTPLSPPAASSPEDAGTPATNPRSLGHRRKLSAFPNTSPSRLSSPVSPKQQPKKPANLVMKPNPTLAIPQNTLPPDSPGFPKMLAAMTFPSPPESSPSHSASNSMSSMSPRSFTTSPIAGRSSTASPASNMDQRILNVTRPPLRQHKSDGAPQFSYMSQQSIATSVGTYDTGSVELSVAKAARPYHDSTAANNTQPDAAGPAVAEVAQGESADAGLSDDSRRQSTVSTTDVSWQSATTSDSHRHSNVSDTSATSTATTTVETSGKDVPNYRDSVESKRTLSTRGRQLRGPGNRDSVGAESVEAPGPLDDDRVPESQRSGTPASLRSVSSAGTSASQTLAERRMARKARVREKLQRDLDASKANLNHRLGLSLPETVDSPVLGWFPQNAPGSQRAAARRASLQANQPSQPSTPTTPTPKTAAASTEKTAGHIARRSSTHDISQLIPETVPESTTPVTPTAPQSTLALSPIMVTVIEPEEPTLSLTISPIMVVASIEGPSPSSTLRPLSLLATTGLPRISIRPEGKSNARQRPLPVRVANPLEMVTTTSSKSNRNSSPSMPTPPISPTSMSSMASPSSRMSLTLQSILPKDPSPTEQAALSSRDKEAQWLKTHQRKTVEDWRLEALEERMRRERLEKEMSETSEEPTDKVDGQEASDADASPLEQCQPMYRHSSSNSSTTKHNSHITTLRALNANANANGDAYSALSSTASDNGEGSKTPANGTEENTRSGEDMELRLHRLEKNVMPLLESMNLMLKEMRRDSASGDMSMKFLDSMLATASASVGIEPGVGSGPKSGEALPVDSFDVGHTD